MLEVIGAGFGRTGTLSLKHALEMLGFGRCYHFSEMLKARHAKRWLAIADGSAPDWESLFRGYRSTTDWPAAAYWRELAAAYPNARVILSVRDPHSWYASVGETIYRLRTLMPRWLPGFGSIERVADRIVWDGEFAGRFADREFAIGRFDAHNRAVRDAVPAERLLIFDVRDGWAPLCEFLGVPIPDAEFPHVNDRRVMRRYVALLAMLRYGGPMLAVALAAFAAVRWAG